MQRDRKGRIVKGTHWREPKPYWNREWLIEMYVERKRSSADIAAEIGTTDANVLYWLKKHSIPRRTVSGARAIKHWGATGAANPMHGKTGAANHRYVDGSSPERHRLYAQSIGKDFLRGILERDRYRCRRCGAVKTEARSLHVHHIKPWAGNPKLRFDAGNVVTLCKLCHAWVHSRENVSGELIA